MMLSMLRYTRELEEDYVVHLVFVRIIDILEDFLSSCFLEINSKATYTHYIRLVIMMNNQQGVIALLVKTGKKPQWQRLLASSTLMIQASTCFSEKGILLLIPAAEYFVKNYDTPAPFHANLVF